MSDSSALPVRKRRRTTVATVVNEDSDEEPKIPADDSDSDMDEFKFMYDEAGYGDAEDRAAMAALTEVQRESELAKRYELRENAKAIWETKRKNREEAARASRELSTDQKSSRRRTSSSAKRDNKKAAALEQLAAQRKRQKERDEGDQDDEDDDESPAGDDSDTEYGSTRRATRQRSGQKGRRAGKSAVAEDSDDDAESEEDARRHVDESDDELSEGFDTDNEDEVNLRPADVGDIQQIRLSRYNVTQPPTYFLGCCSSMHTLSRVKQDVIQLDFLTLYIFRRPFTSNYNV
eukprot:m.169518 g.169518  ORF g.169518 m.169518 type:complete len:291 (-) comp18245_c0_seq1:549-1421(-)